MSTPARLAWLAGCAAMLLAGPAAGQSSLGGQPALAPPAPVAPASPAASARPPQANTAPRPPQAAPAPSPATPAGTPLQAGQPRPSAAQGTGTTQRPPGTTQGTAQRPPAAAPGATARPPASPQGTAARPPGNTQAARPGTAQQQRPGQSAQTAQQRGRAAAAAAAAAGGAAAAGAATAARPPAPAPPPEPPAPRFGSATNLPLPRYASLGSNQVNLRVGPDLRYPIEWTYQRRDLPVQIVDEHQLWRRIRDPEGTEGWVQRPLLTSRRSFLVPAGTERLLRRKPEDGAAEVARLRPGVVGRIRKCETGSAWCEVQVGDYRGFIRRAEIWGVTPDEAVN